VTHDKVYGRDAEAQTKAKIDKFTRAITLKGDLDDNQHQRLLEIADRCPVHQSLERANHIETKLA
jgi:putative redox protein